MRITNKMMSDNFLSDMRLNLENLQTIQQQSTSGKEIRKPSDDPFRSIRAMQLHTDISTNKQYNENISDTKNWLDETDTALGQLGSQMTRIRELLISAGNAAYGTSERQKIKDEINQIVGTMSQVLNSNFDGKYVFGGTRGTTKPTTILNRWEMSSVTVESLNGKATVEGDYIGEVNSDYVIEVIDATNKKVKISLDGGNTFSEKEIEPGKNGKIDIGNGLQLNIDKCNKGDKIKFSCKAGQNAELAFNGTDDTEITLNKFAVGDLSNWNGEFKINGQDITIDGLTNSDPKTGSKGSTIEELVEKINKAIPLEKGIKATSLLVDGKEYIEFKSDNGEKVEVTPSADKDKMPKALENIKSNKEQMDIIGEKLITEISQGVTVEYNVNATEVIKFTDETGISRDLRDILKSVVQNLDSGDPSKVKEICNGDIEAIDKAINNVLKLRSQVGSKQNRMKAAEEKNTRENFDMTEILSKTEDIDLTEKSMEFATMLSVYMASLQVSARVIQPTLMDYLR